MGEGSWCVSEIRIGNLNESLLGTPEQEGLEALFSSPEVRIERIVSWGQGTPEGTWYDQDWTEWVLVVEGGGILEVEGERETLQLEPGDWILIPPHRRHRVVSTSENGPTIWLAVHVESIRD